MIDYHRWEDFHTHSQDPLLYDSKAITSYSLPQSREILPDAWFTVGLHPWDSERLDAYRLVENVLPGLLERPNCLALGEAGLDRLRGADIKVQQELFEQQVKLAERIQIPIVVHCVRAWSELTSVLRAVSFSGRKAIHGFRGHKQILSHLLYDDWYISVGPNKIGQLPEIISEIPADRLLLETDDKAYSIEEVFEMAAKLLDSSSSAIRRLVSRNIQDFVGRRIPIERKVLAN